MKRILYGIFAASLAMGLVGCSGGNGGYWPASPVAPESGNQTQPLVSSMSTTQQNQVLTSSISNISAGMSDAACPMLPTMTFGGAPTAFASIKNSSKSKAKTANDTTTYAVAAEASDYYTFTYTYTTTATESVCESSNSSSCSVRSSSSTSTSTPVTITSSYVFHVKYIDASGKAIPVTTNASYYYDLGTATVNTVMYYGEWTMTEVSADKKFNLIQKASIGNSASPWEVKNLAATSGSKMVKGSSSFSTTGVYNGTAIEGFSFIYAIGSSSNDGYFAWPISSTGNPCGTMSISSSNVTIKYVYDGTSPYPTYTVKNS